MNEKLMAYEKSIKAKKLLLILGLLGIVSLVVYVSLNGGGDSRKIPADVLGTGSLAVVASLAYLIYRIKVYSGLLSDKSRLYKYMEKDLDDRKRYVHEKSGGTVWTVAFWASVIITFIAAEYDAKAFYAIYAMFIVLVVLKVAFYFYFKGKEMAP
jgi:putative copper export protein